MTRYISSVLFLLLTVTTLTACDFGDLTLTVQFKELDGLKSGDRIIFQNEYIGDVEEIRGNTGGPYLVELDVDSDHKEKLTVYSVFYIDQDPERPDRKAVFTQQKRPGGILLTDRSVVAGLDHPPYLSNILDDLKQKAGQLADELAKKLDRATESYMEGSENISSRLEESLAEIEKKLQELENEIRNSPDSREAKKLKKSLNQLITDLEATLEKVKTSISQDLLNRLQETIAKLHKRLEKLNDAEPPSPKQDQDIEEVTI